MFSFSFFTYISQHISRREGDVGFVCFRSRRKERCTIEYIRRETKKKEETQLLRNENKTFVNNYLFLRFSK
jgi:hypothetical protein